MPDRIEPTTSELPTTTESVTPPASPAFLDEKGRLLVPYKQLPNDIRKQVAYECFTLHRQGVNFAGISRAKSIPEKQVKQIVAALYKHLVHDTHAYVQDAALAGFISDVRSRQRQLWNLFAKHKNDPDVQLKVLRQLAEEEGRALDLLARMNRLPERLPNKDEVMLSLAGQVSSVLARPEDKLRATDLLAKVSGWTGDGGQQVILFNDAVMKAARKYMTGTPEAIEAKTAIGDSAASSGASGGGDPTSPPAEAAHVG